MRELNQEAVLLALCTKTFTLKVIIFRYHAWLFHFWISKVLIIENFHGVVKDHPFFLTLLNLQSFY